MTPSTLAPIRDFALARDLMVDGQLRPNKVTDRRILAAMRRLPREAFMPEAAAAMAYIDDDVGIAPGRFMLRPLVIARLIQLATPRAGENALVVGAGSGYGAAVLASCGVHVTALEEAADLVDLAGRALAAAGAQVSLVHGKLAAGCAALAPFDLILIEGAVRAIPDAIGAQLGPTGRLVAIVWPEGGASAAVLAEPTPGGLRARPEFDAAAKLLSPLATAPAFSF